MPTMDESGYPIPPAPGAFVPPTYESLLSDPGYRFRLGTGREALERSAAARGVLRTGGTLKDIIEYGQNLGSQEYGGAFNRALAGYQAGLSAYDRALAGSQAGYGRWWDVNQPRGGGGGGYDIPPPPLPPEEDGDYGMPYENEPTHPNPTTGGRYRPRPADEEYPY